MWEIFGFVDTICERQCDTLENVGSDKRKNDQLDSLGEA